MKQTTINLYSINELEPKAKEKAFNYLRETEADFQTQVLIEDFKIKLEEKGLDLKAWFSLSYNQGDGVCFEGSLDKDAILKNVSGITEDMLDKIAFESVEVTTKGRYTHKNSMALEVLHDDKSNKLHTFIIRLIENATLSFLQDLSMEFERYGYKHFEYVSTEEYLIDLCEANDYTFEIDGSMRNV